MDSNAIETALQRVGVMLAGMPLEELCRAIGKDKSQVSRIRSGELGLPLNDAVRLLYASGLKIVPAGAVIVDQATYEAMATIATKAMARPEIARLLVLGE